MFRLSDLFIGLAVLVSFATSAYMWFFDYRDQAIFTAIWVPSILAFGIYFKLCTMIAKEGES